MQDLRLTLSSPTYSLISMKPASPPSSDKAVAILSHVGTDLVRSGSPGSGPQGRLRKSHDRPLTLPSPGGRGFCSSHMKCSKNLRVTLKAGAPIGSYFGFISSRIVRR